MLQETSATGTGKAADAMRLLSVVQSKQGGDQAEDAGSSQASQAS
jgi:hypothetical protein